VGNYNITYQGSSSADITQKDLTISGISVSDKVYDSTTSATVSVTGISYDGLVEDDVFSVTASGVFDNEHVGTQTVTLTETASGSDVGNYNITYQGSSSADITQKDLTISGISVSDKVYDSTTSATVSVTGISYDGLVEDDVFSVTASGVFDNEHVGTQTVTLTETASGSDVGNYNITYQGSSSADITQKDLTISGISVSDKVYDSTTSATVSVTGISYDGLVEDDVFSVTASGVFDNEHVGTQTVTLTETASGSDVGNYNITYQGSSSADITQKDLTISGISVSDKVYDSTTTATLDVDSIAGFIAGDDVSISAITGTFADEHVDTGIAVSFSDITYAGADKDNYTITDQAGTTADITQKDLTVSGITVSDKTYDSTNSATVSVTGISYSGLVEGDNFSVAATGVFDNEHVGTQTVTLTETPKRHRC
jgi:hypothetical protein